MADPNPTLNTEWRFLSANFFRGTPRGQINSVHKTREDRPEKVLEFRQAVNQGVVRLGPELTKQQIAKLVDLGIPAPPGIRITQSRVRGPRKPRPE